MNIDEALRYSSIEAGLDWGRNDDLGSGEDSYLVFNLSQQEKDDVLKKLVSISDEQINLLFVFSK